jgi:serine/threonine protein kinase
VDQLSTCRLVCNISHLRLDPLLTTPECQQATPRTASYYDSAINDVWSLGVILVNLTCGRNPWKRASPEDSTFKAFLQDRNFLKTILPLSSELDTILQRVFEINPEKRVKIPELRSMIFQCQNFTPRIRTPPPAQKEPSTDVYTISPFSPYNTTYDQITESQGPCYYGPNISQMTASSESSGSDGGSLFSTTSSASSSSSGHPGAAKAKAINPPSSSSTSKQYVAQVRFYGQFLPRFDLVEKKSMVSHAFGHTLRVC